MAERVRPQQWTNADVPLVKKGTFRSPNRSAATPTERAPLDRHRRNLALLSDEVPG
jgi:hypothetical protein